MVNVVSQFIYCDPDFCNGCGICELACSGFKEKRYGPMLSRIRTVELGFLMHMAVACRHCEDPPCVAACPLEALKVSRDTKMVTVDGDRCIGCAWCIQACPYGAIFLDLTKKSVFLCDLCKEELEKGNKPRCIVTCPQEALTLVTAAALATKLRSTAVSHIQEEEKIV